MKKILLSLLMLCTAVSAWSYDTETVTITCGGTNNSPFTVQAQLGSDGADGTPYWLVRNGNNLKLNAQQGYYVMRVAFETTGSYNNVDECDKLIQYGKEWVRDSEDSNYYAAITFSNMETDITKVTSITVTYYHVCYGATPHEAVAGTCTTGGTAAYWECVCGKIYSDADCTDEVTDMAELATEIDPKNHKVELTEVDAVPATCASKGSKEHWYCSDCQHCFEDNLGQTPIENDDVTTDINPTNHKVALTEVDAIPATCVSKGSKEHWYCDACRHCFSDEQGQAPIAGDNVATDIDPKNHDGNLQEVAGKNASVIEEGVLHHWHCQACGNDYADACGNTDITGKTVKAKYDADAILIGMNEGKIIDDSFMLLPSAEETVTVATVTFEEDDTMILDIAGKGGEKTAYSINETNPLETSFAHTFKLKANQDPDHTDRYYSTFFTGEGAYKVPNTATAYTGTVEDGEEEGIDILALGAVEGVIPCGEAVIVRGSEKNITLMPSCKKLTPSTGNILEGTDEATTLGADQYALSLGQHGVGFYLWDGKTIGANKAYLTLDEALGVKALQFRFDDEPGTTGIETVNEDENENLYNLNGLRVGKDYKGIVIRNGKKVILR